MEKRIAELLLLWLAAAVLCWCSQEGAAESATDMGINGSQYSQAKRFPGHNRQPLRETEEDGAQRLVESAETQRYASGKANEMGDMASEKLGGFKNIVSDMAGGLKAKVKDKACDAYAFCSEKAEQGIDMVSNVSTDAKETGKGAASSSYGYGHASDRMNQAGDMKDKASGKAKQAIKLGSDKAADDDKIEKSEAFKRYQHAKSEVYETYASAKDTMTEQAKDKYEQAKERASQATGDLGAKMREPAPLKS
nr:embryonic protein DC-8 [Ipomoea batatas]GMD00860.1 embryonic protein DC-8 [Ipomoea batatas]